MFGYTFDNVILPIRYLDGTCTVLYHRPERSGYLALIHHETTIPVFIILYLYIPYMKEIAKHASDHRKREALLRVEIALPGRSLAAYRQPGLGVPKE